MTSGVYERTPEHCAAISAALTGRTRSPEHCNAISDAKRGMIFTPEHCDAISKSKEGIPLSQEHCDAISNSLMGENNGMYGIRGGNDLVIHHYTYDESDLSLNTVKMTRSDHTSLHNVLRSLGYKVPHVNVMEE